MFLIVTVPGFALHWYPYTTAAAAKSLQSHLNLCDPMTAAHQAPLSLGFCRQEYWSGLPFPFPMHAWMLSRFSCVRPMPLLIFVKKRKTMTLEICFSYYQSYSHFQKSQMLRAKLLKSLLFTKAMELFEPYRH